MLSNRLYSIMLFCLLCACHKDVNIELEQDFKIAALVDLKAGKIAQMHLKLVYTNGSKIGEKALEKNSVVMVQDSNGIQYKCKPTADPYCWENKDLLIRAGETYRLSVYSAGKNITSITSVPSLPNVLMSKHNSPSSNQFSIQLLNPQAQNLYYILSGMIRKYELNGKDTIYSSAWENIDLETQSKETDNIRFGEIYSPYKRLYINLQKSNKTNADITFPLQSPLENIIYQFTVKSVTKSYYDFMYSYDVFTKLDLIVDMIPPSTTNGNIHNGLGIFAGSANMIFEFN